MHRKLEALPQLLGESGDFLRLSALGPRKAQGESDDDLRNVVVTNHARKLLQVGTLVAPLQRMDALSGDPKQIGDGHADTALAYVEAEQASGLLGNRFRSRVGAHSTIIGPDILPICMAADPINFPPPDDEQKPRPEDAPSIPHIIEVNSLATTVIAVVSVGAALYYAQLVCVVVLVALLLAFVLEPIVRGLTKIRAPRSLAALAAVLLFCAALYGIGNASYNKAVEFSKELPKYRGEIQKMIWKYRHNAETITKNTRSVIPKDDDGNTQTVEVKQPSGLWNTLTENMGTATEVIFAASFVPFLAFFMLSWQEHARASTVLLFRRELRSTAYATLGAITEMIRAFIVGNFLVGVFIGIISTVVFWLIGVPYFYFVGFISGFLSLVPYLGVLLAFIPPGLAGLGTIHGSAFLFVGITVLGLHLFALNVLYPKFLGSRLQLNPLAVTLALLFWGWIWGAMGLILAIPMTAAMKIVFDHIPNLRALGAWLGE